MSFDNIVGHSRQIGVLKKALSSGRIAHAYLFCGPEGIGKATVAVEFGRALLCDSQRADSCGLCTSCGKISRGTHPDFLTIGCDNTQIKIEQIRQLQSQLVFSPQEGHWRFILIDNAHNLTIQAANCLLKTLEEPPGGNLIVLVATSPHSLPSTIASRCQVMRFSPLSTDQLIRYLVEMEGWEMDEASRVAPCAMGSIKRALELKETPLEEEIEGLLGLVEESQDGAVAEIFRRVQQMNGGREETRLRLQYLEGLMRDLLLVKLGMNRMVSQEAHLMRLQRLTKGWTTEDIFKLWSMTRDASKGLEANWNPVLTLEHIFVRAHEMNRPKKLWDSP